MGRVLKFCGVFTMLTSPKNYFDNLNFKMHQDLSQIRAVGCLIWWITRSALIHPTFFTSSNFAWYAMSLLPIKNNFSTLARFHHRKRLFIFTDGKFMRDSRRNIQAALQHANHFVPRLKHFPSVNSFDV